MSTDRAQRQRREIKYMIREEEALAIRSYLSSYLEPDENAVGKPDNSYSVHTLYLDSNHLATFRAANDGDRNRFKLRIRYYDEDPLSPVFFEIKRRINEGIAKQRARVKREAVRSLLSGESPLPEHLFKWNPQHWSDLLDFWQLVERLEAAPRAHNAYLREAYVNGDASVRVTLDRAIQICPEFGGELGTAIEEGVEVFGGFVVLELKFTERMPTWLIEMVRGFELKSSGAAKYVQGVEMLGEQRVARRRSGFEWGNAVTSTATSAPWLDASAAVRRSLGPNRQ
jgi:SPX domain protein involved in polyphosphate accumulation